MEALDRFYLFWWICIPVRLGIGGAALGITLTRIHALFYLAGALSAAVAIGFAANVICTVLGCKTRGGLGGRVWWRRARVIHCMLWAVCAALCFTRTYGAGAILLLDAVLGCIFGLFHFVGNLDL